MHFDVTRLEREARLAVQVQWRHREELSDLRAEVERLKEQLCHTEKQ